jgi:hypothetical protein
MHCSTRLSDRAASGASNFVTTGNSTSTTVAPRFSSTLRALSQRAMTDSRVCTLRALGSESTPPMYIFGTPTFLPASDVESARSWYVFGRTNSTSGSLTKGWALQKSHVVSSSFATITSRRANISSTVLVCGTTVSQVGNSGQLPLIEIKPLDGV